jgi:hypothetical protein
VEASTGKEVIEVIRTDDLFLGAFGLTRGGELRDVEVRGVNSRRVAFFRITGPSMEEVEREYYRGHVLVNLRMLKAAVARLKNVAFDALRKEESRDDTRTSRGRFKIHREAGRRGGGVRWRAFLTMRF